MRYIDLDTPALRIDGERFAAVSAGLRDILPVLAQAETTDRLRGLEGSAAVAYFSVLDEMILQSKDTFFFTERSRRPPLDAFNALLSFAYSLLAHDCASAMEAERLDAYVGFLHRDRPGRESLALDLMVELRRGESDATQLRLAADKLPPEGAQTVA